MRSVSSGPNLPCSNSTRIIGSARIHSAAVEGRLNSRPNSMARLWLAIADSVWPARNWRDSSGSSAVPTAMPITASGSSLMRSA